MGKIIAFESLTLDGVMQAPGRPDEDVRGGFRYGGWAMPYADPAMDAKVTEESSRNAGGLLFGRRTYEQFYSYFPAHPENPFSAVLNNSQKYVASRTLKEPLPWANSTLLNGDAREAVAALKAQQSKDLVVLGSGELVRSLMSRNLVDQYVLRIHPLILGSGRRLFDDGGAFSSLRLVDSKTSATGVVIATFEPAKSNSED
jgi:dihydrofolate reductase